MRILLLILSLFLYNCGGGSSSESSSFELPNAPLPALPSCTTIDTFGLNEIYNADDLYDIRNGLDGSYILMADLDLSAIDWQPIGTESNPFTGEFDGNCHVISNLSINNNVDSNLGLFGYVSDAKLRNILLDDFSINAKFPRVGGIVGYLEESSVNNTHVVGSIQMDCPPNPQGENTANAAGIAGVMAQSSIENSSAAVNIATSCAYVGGITSNMIDASIVRNSFSTGSMNVGGQYAGSMAGGIVGSMATSSIENSYSSLNINTTKGYAGGLAGIMAESTIQNSYSTGQVYSTSIVGGIAGAMVKLEGDVSKIIGCVAANPIVRAGGGRIVSPSQFAEQQKNLVIDSLVLDTMKGNFSVYAPWDGTDVSKLELQDEATYRALGWEFTPNAWKMPNPGGLPILWWQKP